MAIKPKPDIRKLKRARYEAEHRELPRRDPAETKRIEAQFLKVANDHVAERKVMADHNIDEYANEAASYVRNRAFGAVSVIGGRKNGYRLGVGRWRFQPGKGWVKIGG